ncbi:helix-turn-helix transcriptional regulator [Flavobacterium sp. PLA-1-15]|uniref:helix-turn-helix transcriptional regulator n=1 Tax=Flavobacterium sp. PLA-1-15 TaxID=3380533 RepID=UPI003B7E5AA0
MILNRLSFLKTLLVCVLLACLSCSDSQDESVKAIDVLIAKAHKEFFAMDYLEIIKYAKEAEVLALKTHNTEKLPQIYLYFADGLAGLELQKESIEYLNRVMKMNFENKDVFFKARVYQVYAFNYAKMGLGAQSLTYQRKSVSLLSQSKSYKELLLLNNAYSEISIYHYNLRNADSAFYYVKKQEAIFNKFPEKETYHKMVTTLRMKGYLLLEFKKENDSALYYFQKTYDLRKKYHNQDLAREYLGFGDYYYLKGDNAKAIAYYHKAEQNAKERKSKFKEDNDINRVLAGVYEELKNPERQNLYLKKYTVFNDSLKIVQQQNVDVAVTLMMQTKSEETLAAKKNYTLLLSLVLGFLVVGGIFLYVYLKRKKVIALKTEQLLTEQETIIHQKEEENYDLKQRVNDSFEEVIQLAKENSIEFFTRFKEVYPEVVLRLLQINPKLRVTELTLCAYFFLGFTTKDIAKYTFKSVNTVRNRRQNLRGKLNIPSEEDIELWFKKL